MSDERRKPRKKRVPVSVSVTRPRPLDDAPITQNGNGHKPLPMINGEVVDPHEISAEVEAMGAEEAIRWATETFGSGLGFAVSFQKTSSVILDLAHRLDVDAKFFYIDTELLFPETYATRDRLAEHFGIDFDRYVQDNPPDLAARWHAGEWGEDDECCAPRKVATMRRALEGVDCWVSGVRRVDSETRAGARRFGWDVRFDRWKLNPLADWDDKQVWTYIKENHVPYNPLHDQGYPSIGCMPCTTKPNEGDDSRAGRWAGTDRTECGING
jgi:phosphoadenosine phosphosulfate reductase